MNFAPDPFPPRSAYPVRLTIDYQEQHSRVLIFFKWFLAIPHFFVLTVLAIGAVFVWIGAFFGVLFTGRYPVGLFDYMVRLHRYQLRLMAYVLNLTDLYPAFSGAEDPAHPVHLSIDYPEQGVERWRIFFAYILGYPYALAASTIGYVGYLIGWASFFPILFTGRYPKGMFDFVEAALRWVTRGGAYQTFMVTLYPPFEM